MSRGSVIGIGLLLVAGLGVGLWVALVGDPAPLDARLIGFRYRADGGGPTFDRGAPPAVKLPPGEPPVVEWHGAEVLRAEVAIAAVPDGRIVRVTGWVGEPQPGPGALVVRAGGGERRWAGRWSTPPEDHPLVAEVAGHRAAGEIEQARAALAAAGAVDVETELWLGVERARVAQAAGQADEAVEAWLEAAEVARRAGLITERTRRLRSAAYVAWVHRRAATLADIIERAAPLHDPIIDPGGLARLRQLDGQLSFLLDDWQAARRALEDAIARFESLGDTRPFLVATEALALLLADLGDADAALHRLESVGDVIAAADPDARARYALNLGWLTLRALPEARTEAQRDTLRARLDAARQAAEASGDRLRTANAAVNQAWGALALGDLAAAASHLADARALDPDGEGFAAPYATLLQARLDLARGRLDAAEVGFRRVEARAGWEQGDVSELSWRAKLGLGRVMRRRGDFRGARDQFDRALHIVDALGRRAALRGDRATFHADRTDLVDEAIDLTAEREPWRAFGYADAARARPMRALQSDLRVGALGPETRRKWAAALDGAREAADEARAAYARLRVAPVAEEAEARARARAADEAREAAFDAAFAVLDTATPAPPGISGGEAGTRLRADEILFAFHRGWAFRVEPIRGATARPLPAGDPLGDWRDLPDAVRHVYIVPGGHPDAFRLATAGDDPLLARASVSFLPYAGLLAQPAEAADGPPLVVADPRRDLSFAAAEGAAVAKALPGATLLSGPAADRSAVLGALAGARLFHFAGHGILHPERPWDAHLRLAGADTLTLSDVLTHPVGARLVMLSGCETGVDAVLLDEAVVGLPEAFLAAGARAVLATDREVDDRATRRFVERFYAAGGAERPAAALRIAALAAREAGDPAWSAFRMIGLRSPGADRR